MEGDQATGESRGEIRWRVTGGEECIEHARGGQAAHQRCPFDGLSFPANAIAAIALDDGHDVEIDAISQPPIEPHLVQARLVTRLQARVVDEAVGHGALDLDDAIPGEKDPGDVRLDHLDRVRMPGIGLRPTAALRSGPPFLLSRVLPAKRGAEEAADAEGDRGSRHPEEHLPQAGAERTAAGDDRDRGADDEQADHAQHNAGDDRGGPRRRRNRAGRG